MHSISSLQCALQTGNCPHKKGPSNVYFLWEVLLLHSVQSVGANCYSSSPISIIKCILYQPSIISISTSHYRPQRSWAKVMFLQASVILSTGGGVPGLVQGGTWQTPPWTRYTPRIRTTRGRYASQLECILVLK